MDAVRPLQGCVLPPRDMAQRCVRRSGTFACHLLNQAREGARKSVCLVGERIWTAPPGAVEAEGDRAVKDSGTRPSGTPAVYAMKRSSGSLQLAAHTGVGPSNAARAHCCTACVKSLNFIKQCVLL